MPHVTETAPVARTGGAAPAPAGATPPAQDGAPPTLRVWHVYLTGGMQRVDGIVSTLAPLADSQARSGNAVTVWLVGDPAALTDAVGGGAFGVEIGGSTAQVLATMRRRLRSVPPDIVHLHSCLRPPHAAVVGMLRPARVPYVISPHSGLSAPTLARYRWRKCAYGALIERRLVRNAAGLACLTPVEHADATRYAPRFDGRVGVIANPAPQDLFTQIPWSQAASDPTTVVTLARWDVHQKGLDVLADIARQMPEVSFAVHGAQDRNQPRATERLRRSAPPNFALLPPVYGREKLDVLRGAGMFIQPSRWEGMSASLIEAMVLGVPCAVSTYVARTLPFASDGLGLVLSADTTVATQQVRRALGDRSARAAWSTAGRLHALSTFAPQRVAEQLVDFYHRSVSHKTSQASSRPRADHV